MSRKPPVSALTNGELSMRTDDEIVAKIKDVEATGLDCLGTLRGDLIECLAPYDAKQFFRDDANLSEWKIAERTPDAIKARMLDYMPFAWGKANNNRGISAGRSLDHMSAWLWLLGYDQAAEQVLDYDLYGKPWLRAICEAFGWNWRQWDDGRWTNDEMSDGHAPPETVPALAVPGLQGKWLLEA